MGRASKRKATFSGGVHVKKRVKITLDRGNWKGFKSRHQALIHGSAMQVTSASTSNDSNKKSRQEAHMIPGLRDGQIWGFPNSIITTMRYTDYFILTPAAAGIAENVFSANGIFDPDITGVGHQPMWHDNYFNIYNHYTVLGSKITVKFSTTNNGSTTIPHIIGVIGDDNATASTTISTRMETSNSFWTLGNANDGHQTLTATFEPLDNFGVDAKDDGTSATQFGANPTEQWYFIVWCAAVDAAIATLRMGVTVEIEYTVKCAELKSQGQN